MAGRKRALILAVLAVLAVAVTAFAIVGGRSAPKDKLPWVTQVRVDGKFKCTGSLVAPRWVLTAAHCVYVEEGWIFQKDTAIDERRLSVVLGKSELSEGGKGIGVDRFIVNSDYDFKSASHDIALLHLRESFSAQPVQLPTVDAPRQGEAGSRLTVAGWGSTVSVGTDNSRDHIAQSLQQLKVVVGSDEYCSKGHAFLGPTSPFRPNLELCSKARRNFGACHGDSGGPLFEDSESEPLLVGIVHGSPRGDVCARKEPVLYARVADGELRDWVLSVIGSPPMLPRVQEVPEARQPARPRGPLTADGLGPTRIGMSQSTVVGFFGQPDHRFRAGEGIGEQISQGDENWTWEYPMAGLNSEDLAGIALLFHNGRLRSYVCTVDQFATPEGYRVGSAITTVRQDSEYKDSTLSYETYGGGNLLAASGVSSGREMQFDFDDTGEIRTIYGGDLPDGR